MCECMQQCYRVQSVSSTTAVCVSVCSNAIEYSQSRAEFLVVSSYMESCNNKPVYGYNIMLPNLSHSPNLYKIQSVYNNNVAS